MKSQQIITPQVKVVSKVEFGGPQKRVGILGGTFNPPHLGHLIIADQVRSQLGLDKVQFMPNNLPPHVDHKDTIEAKYRLKMLQLSITDNKYFEIEDYEIHKGGVSYSIDTLKELMQLHPENEYYFIIGGDMITYLPKWRQIDELVKLVKFVGVCRPGYKKECRYPILWVDVPQLDISSTLIRQKVKHGCSIKYLVTDAVADYIQKEKLYFGGD